MTIRASHAQALGAGHRRSDSKTKRSSVSTPCDAAAAATAACAIAGFHPNPVSAALACVHRIATSSLLAEPAGASPALVEVVTFAVAMEAPIATFDAAVPA